MDFVTLSGWKGFFDGMNQMFREGLGTYGLQGIGIAITVVGLAMAVISYFVHKANQQSRLPGWFTWLVVALVGVIATSGIDKPIELLTRFKDWLFSLVS